MDLVLRNEVEERLSGNCPKTALGTDEQLVSQVAVVDARPFTLFTTEGYTTFRPDAFDGLI